VIQVVRRPAYHKQFRDNLQKDPTIQQARHRRRLWSATFGTSSVARIRVEPILAYIRERKEKGISNTTVNMELGILQRILKRAKTWHLVADDCKPLPERRDIGRALKHEDKLRLLRVAASKPEWQLARLAATLALNTTMRGCEIRGLRWRDIDLLDRMVTVRRAETKMDAGHRLIPLSSTVWAAILESRERAKLLFGVEPQPIGTYSPMEKDKGLQYSRSADRDRRFR
jgi:integrase